MNTFFDDYVHSETTLKRIVEQYDNALKSKIEKEDNSDFTSFNSIIPIICGNPIEKKFQSVYINKIFKLFQNELQGLMFCNTSFVKEEGLTLFFEVMETVYGKDGTTPKEISFWVQYSELQCQMKCLCRLFKFRGIVCRHLMSVLVRGKYGVRVRRRFKASRSFEELHRVEELGASLRGVEDELRWWRSFRASLVEDVFRALLGWRFRVRLAVVVGGGGRSGDGGEEGRSQAESRELHSMEELGASPHGVEDELLLVEDDFRASLVEDGFRALLGWHLRVRLAVVMGGGGGRSGDGGGEGRSRIENRVASGGERRSRRI
ncbi:hypothetical protein ZIOFF_000008 [Zingiber officinale]|uniref:Protein FAR1-RELATED SEQUENCE n=1 Tax=Zingiber officinale TaxID=94328 RepID=A0A8J5IGV2_ZINOF|nr:hypothetical protein ZIOFF_000008 [Zingiber officinale]